VKKARATSHAHIFFHFDGGAQITMSARYLFLHKRVLCWSHAYLRDQPAYFIPTAAAQKQREKTFECVWMWTPALINILGTGKIDAVLLLFIFHSAF